MSKPAKRAVNLRIDEALIDQAKALNVNLSQTLEMSLVEILREKQRAAWLAENREAVQAYNSRIEKQGLFSDGLRQF
ncbi:MAG: acetoacetyl-CoA synthase [Zetaproteobacteria bacterium CG_4_9_14_3_um_filter_49_83]|nr:MAG: acetoacetyl-CoA synthase [Zetaproteobacteria bacterium CG1_02_49_23]PIQ34179.1 MAG: acetoacetyl-CoA synthase [Zetaproteobacteria bacterium CG17_big_fil_post_rev_8_21_14_2_50_50_13]PIV29450.1 MAG: acetoacetyl-CoA synthase [Zetaproteobacteria bacterium CG02_land_8_20_14_3_00_50_9]PIY56954.1 MAG: acetoacetyl-CoA synthase [Zetaproteobacteria bacterium CG_4_10_14_0_8_um_filter_49_80]PJA35351.1 MAG: acetoacetyl-CoA synthase [Zetaproteobacteria bacterium CG_4_9_14_3_um_filter_49_83]